MKVLAPSLEVGTDKGKRVVDWYTNERQRPRCGTWLHRGLSLFPDRWVLYRLVVPESSTPVGPKGSRQAGHGVDLSAAA